ncbi:helix-turn-helix transcriptional regulator [Amycolatopsis sp. NPDC088138]|uniref:helix-turn-helix transcriptional regulator n=1 Tax=Amycolatopsis sp. NPDC088138 TaxID=3363938 RepID=UPI0037FC5E07
MSTPPQISETRFTSTDFDCFRDWFENNLITFHRHGVGREQKTFTGSAQLLTTNGLGLLKVQSTPVPQIIVEPLDGLLIMTARSPLTRIEVSAGKRTVTSGLHQPALLPPTERAFARTGPLNVSSVALNWKTVLRTAAESVGLPKTGLTFDWERSPAPDLGRHWLATVDYVRHAVFSNAVATENPIILAEATHLLAATLLATFTHSGLGDDTRTEPGTGHDPAPAAVRRAVAFIETHSQSPITITDIAEAARIGPRALHYAFRRHQDITPMAYLRQVRLDHAHHELQKADPARGDTVAAIAARWGFAHAARFAATYRETYGVTPASTLRQ